MHKAGKPSDTSLEIAFINAALRVLKLGNQEVTTVAPICFVSRRYR
jgi:hypothetical protein